MKTLLSIAEAFGLSVRGDEALEIQGVANPNEAGPQDLVFLVEPKYSEQIAQSKAPAYVGRPQDVIEGKSQLVAENPRLAMAQILALFAPSHPQGIHPTAVISPDAVLGQEVAIGAGCYVGSGCKIGDRTVIYPNVTLLDGVQIGEDSLLYPQVVIREHCQLGDRVILQPGTVIGSDGYGFVTIKGRHIKMPQIGQVIIEDDVEIGANVAVDRATIGETRIKRGTKIDNLVHIAHNDIIGEDVLIVSQTGISGSVEIGDRCILAGQVGVAGHLSVGHDTLLYARTGVTKDIPPKSMYSGFPAKPHREQLRRDALPEMVKRLTQRLEKLEEKIST